MNRAMSSLSLFSLGLCIATCAPIVARMACPIDFTSEAGRYRAKFPDKPATTSKDLSTGKQVVRVVNDRAPGPHDLVFAVTFTDYPDSFTPVAPSRLLDGVTRGLTGQDGRVVSQTPLDATEGIRAGRSLRIDAGKNAIRAKILLVGTRLYQVMVTGPRESMDDPSVGEFLDSFEVLK